MENLSYLWPMLLGHVPSILVAVLGLILALVNLREHPAPARLVLFASALLIAGAIAQPVTTTVLMSKVRSGAASASSYSWLTVFGFGFALLHAGALALFVFAAFAGRRVNRPPAPPAMPAG